MLTSLFPYMGIACQHELCKDFNFMELEIWKDIAGYEGLYMVSNLGRIKGLEREIPANGLGYRRVNKEKVLRPAINGAGYRFAVLCVNYNKKTVAVHRAVAIAFIANPSSKPDVNHKNGNKSDNFLTNLEWVTESENAAHALKSGLVKTKAIKQYFDGVCINTFPSVKDASNQLNLNKSSIKNALSGRVEGYKGFNFKYA